MSPARRIQAIVAGIASVLLLVLWVTENNPGSMNFAIPAAMAILWLPVVLAQKQRQGSIAWNSFFGLLGIAVVAVAVRATWMIGLE